MYGTGTVGLQECWAKLVYLIASQLPANEQSQPSYRTIALPVSLSPNAQLAPSRFVTTSSRCAEDVPLDTKATSELIRALLTALNSNLMIDCNPWEPPVRIPATLQCSKDPPRTVVLIGASNMRRCIPALGALGYLTVDLTHVGWGGSDAAIERLRSELAKLENSIYVLDLLTSTSYCFIQADGSLALPVKIGSKFHLPARFRFAMIKCSNQP